MLNAILDEAVPLVQANRADVFWWDDTQRQFIVAARAGAGSLDVGQALPQPSITRIVYRSRKPYLSGDVSAEPEYFCGCCDTRSEVAVPLLRADDPEAAPLGVLNLESAQLRAFDERDVSVLEYLARYAALAGQLVESRDAIYRRMLDQMAERSLHPEEALYAILESVRRGLDLDEGLIYIADHRNAVLRCTASLPRRSAAQRLIYKFDQASFASKVFREKRACFSPDPWQDEDVAKDGLRSFEIHSPLVGVPLLFGSSAVGVLVVWSRGSRLPEPHDRDLLAPYARLAVTTIAIAEFERQQSDALAYLREVLTQMQKSGGTLAPVLHTVLAGVTHSGFDRARVFSYRSDDRAFVCLDSFGEQAPGFFSGFEVRLEDNPYAQRIAELAEAGHYEPRVFDPAEEMGEDPYADRLKKPPGLP